MDDARFDHHLPIGHIDRFDEIAHRLQIRRNLTDDQLIGALVDDDPRARRSDVLEQSGDVARACVRQFEADGRQRNVQALLFGEAPIRRRFFSESGQRADAHDVAVEHVRQAVLTEDQVEGLVPRNVDEIDGHGAVHVRIDGDVQTGELRERAQNIFDVRVFEVQRDRLAGEHLPPRAQLT